MALELQHAVTDLVVDILGADQAETPAWLLRPGRAECGERWPLVCEIYADLTGGAKLPEAMPPTERRRVDCVLSADGTKRILEVDEKQHFNHFRAQTLQSYETEVPVAFPVSDWMTACEAKRKLEGGGFARPRPPLFPEATGRHQQRAFRDALADLIPGTRGWLPTLRFADFEVKSWIVGTEARDEMKRLLASRL